MKLVIDIPEAVYKCVMDGTYCGTLYEELKNGVPVDRKPGKWIHIVVFWECDQCHAKYMDMPTCIGRVIYEYCPMCGAKMEVQDEQVRNSCKEVETLRRDVRELKELLGYIRKYGVASDSTPKHIGQRFCEIVDGWEEQDGEDSN